MREKDSALAAKCREWGDIALEAERWLSENQDLAGAEGPALCKELRSATRTFKRLATAASRKMCIAVFGPSQAGKSYLISALAMNARGELNADFCGQSVDFISKINPEGGKESTGLVTRFTTSRPEGVSPDFPVRLRLFSEKDLVRIIANTYYNDIQDDETPSPEELIGELRELARKKRSSPCQSITVDDVEDICEYMQRFKGNARVQMLNNAYWKQAQELAPWLGTEDRARLFGLIWKQVPEFTEFFAELAGALERLGNVSEASCPLSALVPREASIIDVSMLVPRKDGKPTPGTDEELTLRADNGHTARLTRRQVTAVTAELTIYMPEEPAPFFRDTDLLDFPGYRSRLKTSDLARALERKEERGNFFLRGKVAYLFERYSEEREITGMLLCIGPENQEVQDLPNAIDEWINKTQGATPAERRGHDPMLFFVLTKVDKAFEEKKGAEIPVGLWENRMQSSFIDFFGRAHKWPADWDGAPFSNIFLLRNPNVVCEIFDHDKGLETGIREDKTEQVTRVRQSFFNSPLVKRHFKDSELSWNAVMKPNDGGIGLLRKRLAPICDPDRKYNQTRDRANEKARELVVRLNRFYRSDDVQERIQQQTALGRQLVGQLTQLVQLQRFADFLTRFLVCDNDLYARAMDCCEPRESGNSQPAQIITGTVTSADSLMDELFGDAPAPVTPAASPQAAPAAPRGADQVEVFCRSVMEHWTTLVREQCANPAISRVYHLSDSFLESFSTELIKGTDRTRLLESMIEAIREISSFVNITREMAAWRMASVAAYRINSYVCWLGHDERLGQTQDIVFNGRPVALFKSRELTWGPHGEPVVPERVEAFDRLYYTDWLKAFFELVVANAVSADDEYDPASNERLGAILKSLEPMNS